MDFVYFFKLMSWVERVLVEIWCAHLSLEVEHRRCEVVPRIEPHGLRATELWMCSLRSESWPR